LWVTQRVVPHAGKLGLLAIVDGHGHFEGRIGGGSDDPFSSEAEGSTEEQRSVVWQAHSESEQGQQKMKRDGWRVEKRGDGGTIGLARSVGSAGLLKAGLTLGAPVLRISGRSKDARHGMSIASLLPTGRRSDGPQRLGFRAQRLQVTGWQVLERFKCGFECGEQTTGERRGGPQLDSVVWTFSGGEWPVRRHQQQRRRDAQRRGSKQYGLSDGEAVLVCVGFQLSEAWRTIGKGGQWPMISGYPSGRGA
jgi:hypothetical protein